MTNLNRIVIMGSPGTGKSTLAYKIAQQTKLPLYHMDALFWQGTQNVSDDVLLERLDTILQKEQWIIDGLSLIHISEPTRLTALSRMPSSA